MRSLAVAAKMRLAIVASHPVLFQSVLFRKLTEARELEVEVFFHSSVGAGAYFDVEFGRSVEWDLPVLGGFKHQILEGNGGTRTLARRLSNGDFDALLLNGWGRRADWGLALAAVWARVPVLVRSDSNVRKTTRGLRRIAKSLLLGGLFKMMSGFLVAGKLNAAFYTTYGADPSKLFAVPFAIENERFRLGEERAQALREEIRSRHGISKDAVVFLFVGKLVPHKRPLDLLEAARRLPAECKAVALFAGDGELRAALESRSGSTRSGTAVLAGFVNQAELPAYYAAADVFVLPSEREAWGLVVNEAACASLPLLLSDQVGAGPDFVEEGRTGYAIRVGDVDGLARRMEQLALDPNMRRAMGGRARKLADAHDPEVAAIGVRTAVAAAVNARGRR